MQRHAEVKYLLVLSSDLVCFVVLGLYVYLCCSQLRPALSFLSGPSLSLSLSYFYVPLVCLFAPRVLAV